MKNRIFILLTILALISSCVSKRKLVYTKYYLIEPPHKLQTFVSKKPNSDLKLEIGTISVSPAYSSTRIVHRSRSNEIVYFSYHEWAVLPELSMAQMATKYFRSTHDFAEVSKYISDNRPDYRLDIEVSRIEMLDISGEVNAHILITYTYTDVVSGRLIAQETFDKSSKMAQKDMNLLAEAVSALLWESLTQFFKKMAAYHSSEN